MVARTSSEIGDFFARYVQGAERLPLHESYGLLGIDVVEDARGIPTRFAPRADATPEQLRLREAWLRGGEPPAATPSSDGGGCRG